MRVNTWFERDRAYVGVETDEGEPVLDLWDEAVTQAVEDGFLDMRNITGSAIEYAKHLSGDAA